MERYKTGKESKLIINDLEPIIEEQRRLAALNTKAERKKLLIAVDLIIMSCRPDNGTSSEPGKKS